MSKMSAMRRYLTAEKTAHIMEWVDKVNSQPCIGMKPRESSEATEPKDITLPAAIPAKTTAEKGRPPKYRQLTLKSTRLRRVRTKPRESRKKDEQENEKMEARTKEEERQEEEHVKKSEKVAQPEKKYGEEKKDQEVKKGVSEQALPSNPIMSSIIDSNLRMFCVEIVIPSSGKKPHDEENQASGDTSQANSEKRKRGRATRGRGGRTKCPKLAVENG
ncbi:hypothetical protein GTR04_1296 [Trichophyton interdigitale]|uniref:Uncharacterized protein n=1 Tax=Trichophyton interdigitale TaxID=101480 RepID=A0A9P5D210_9EURO|nr:hypothetical protein GY631_0215 [Trichophyton interdigitale]KAF3901153.1 hypothetical protein GY632_0192 [Trichophyton interdigitale]KAG8211345.1 hypothetical protein GTR04_1296 [Trichophyton interdigitale]